MFWYHSVTYSRLVRRLDHEQKQLTSGPVAAAAKRMRERLKKVEQINAEEGWLEMFQSGANGAPN